MGYGEGIGGRIRAEIDWIYDAVGESGKNELELDQVDTLVEVLGKIASDADKLDGQVNRIKEIKESYDTGEYSGAEAWSWVLEILDV